MSGSAFLIRQLFLLVSSCGMVKLSDREFVSFSYPFLGITLLTTDVLTKWTPTLLSEVGEREREHFHSHGLTKLAPRPGN